MTDGLHNYHTVIEALHEQANSLGETVSAIMAVHCFVDDMNTNEKKKTPSVNGYMYMYWNGRLCFKKLFFTYHHDHWAAVVCRFQVSLSCAVLCQIVSFLYTMEN